MTCLRPYKALRPAPAYASATAALPYDVFTPEMAADEAQKNPLSFIRIDRPETQFAPGTDMYADKVYEAAYNLLQAQTSAGIYKLEEKPCLYIYELTFNGRTQTGIGGLASVSDYKNGVIKKHEQTREAKERDRYRHIKACRAQTGLVFLTYKHCDDIDTAVKNLKKALPVYDFYTGAVRQKVWVIDNDSDILNICRYFQSVPEAFIADGHHRAAAAARFSDEYGEDTGIMSVFFPDNQLLIYPYFRVVKDLNNQMPEQFLNALSEDFFIEPFKDFPTPKKSQAALYLNGWYLLTEKTPYSGNDVIRQLDVSMIQEKIIEKQLCITDIRNDTRIDFIGGIYGADAVLKRCKKDMALGIITAAVELSDLFAVAKAGKLMPPKSTWFEPKLCSGLLIYPLFKDKFALDIIE